jgi:peptidoglycan/xylan/chitin deacetylase (PgdA/CDA1 family)
VGKDLERVPGDRKVIALTFDAGAAPDGGDRILDILGKEKVPATFFLTGAFVKDNPALSRRIAASYPVGNHTQTHPDLTKLGDAAVQAEIDKARDAIAAATGQDPRPYFRFPFGAVDKRTIALVNSRCYVPFRWTVDTLGWKGTSGGMSADKVLKRVLDGASPGGIVLMHIGTNPTDKTTLDADALPRIITELRARGYTFVTLEAVLPASP